MGKYFLSNAKQSWEKSTKICIMIEHLLKCLWTRINTILKFILGISVRDCFFSNFFKKMLF